MTELVFEFLTIPELKRKASSYAKLLQDFTPEELQRSRDSKYTIYRRVKGRTKECAIVTIVQLIWQEVESSYHQLCELYGKDIIDSLIVDESVVRFRVGEVVEFAMDELYHVDTMRITFYTAYSEPAAATAIYAALQENYIIESQEINMHAGVTSIQIRRRNNEG